LTTMEQCLNSEPSRAHDQSVLQKAAEAQFLVKKSEREDLYALLGVKGVGELGTIGATPSVVNAVADALSRAGKKELAPKLQMPLTAPRLWELMQA